MFRLAARAAPLFAAVSLMPCAGVAQQAGYRQPPVAIAQILDAPPPPRAIPSPTGDWLLVVDGSGDPSIREVGAPFLRLAGVRVNPRTNGPRIIFGAARGLRLVRVNGGGDKGEHKIETPDTRRISNTQWSPDGAHVAYTVASDTGIALWVADVATGKSRRVGSSRLNAAARGAPCSWISVAQLVCAIVPAGRGPAPTPPEIPTGPAIQETEGGGESAIWTYEDLLTKPSDEVAFDYYFTSQLALVGLDGSTTPIGKPAIHAAVRPSPDGKYLEVETVHRPYSYQVPLENFPLRIDIWSIGGTVVKQVADRRLQDAANNFDHVMTGPRSISWRADAPATLVWGEALDDGNPKRAANKRDRVFTLAAPFSGTPQPLTDLGYRLTSVQWTRGGVAFVTEGWMATRRSRSWMIDTRQTGMAPRLFVDRNTDDRYGDPGTLVTARGPYTLPVVATTADGRFSYRTGPGGAPEGDQPFLDRVELATGATQRLWRSAAPFYEEVVALLDPEAKRALARRESVQEPPNYFIRDLASGKTTQLTTFKDPAPQLAGVTKQLLRYKRADGVDLTATMYLPAGYSKSKGPLPFFLWAYPREFKDAASAGQTIGSPYRFTRPGAGSDHLLLLTQGYGVLDGPTMPIVGEGDREPNDTYVEQLVASAKAAVVKIVDMGVADRDRIAVGGHSYGAFMTANLLAHSRLFKAGVARSGAYNRTLTPFGFQRESRTYWQARDVYTRMSPFVYADSVKDALLLIHGTDDSNPGTFPINSERMYAAVKGHGGHVRLVMLPAEDHGYLARESIGHVLAEMVSWLDANVKNKKPRAH